MSINGSAIVAAPSVVVVHVPQYAIVGGNPPEALRVRFNVDTVWRLQAIS
jgi:acetyltransferase-like isoleucine patch superfamily enzyme